MIPNILLASNSPRRKQLLALGGWQFTVQPADVDETPRPGEAPRLYTLRLAEEKARVAAHKADLEVSPLAERLVIASDTTVADGEMILGKPVDTSQAVAMLQQLRSRPHGVFTAVAVLFQGTMHTDVAETEVLMRSYTDAEMLAYAASGDPLDKAGAYAIQHAGFHPVEKIVGCYANVMGLPLCHLARLLTRLEIPHSPNLPHACQQALSFDCQVFPDILGLRKA